MAAQAGERRLRALYPEPGHRQWVAPPPAHLKCSVCEEPFGRATEKQPVALPCGHTFCRLCSSKGVKPASLGTDIVIQDTLDLLPVFCRFGLRESQEGEWEADPQGCPAQLPAGEAAAHEAACGFELLRCSFAGCGAKLRRSQIDAHDAAEALRHARGEREARLALEASSVARISAAEAELVSNRARNAAACAGSGVWKVQRTLSVLCPEEEETAVSACAFSPDDVLVASVGDLNGLVKLYTAATGAPERDLSGHTGEAFCCSFCPGEEGSGIVLSGSSDCTLNLWRVSDGECLHTMVGHTNIVYCCAFSPDGRQVLSGSKDKTLKLWDAGNGACIRTFKGHTDWVCGCAFSPDGATILSASDDRTLKLCRASDGECLRTLVGHTNAVYGCAFSPDGALIVSSSWDAEVKLWNAATGACTRTMRHGEALLPCGTENVAWACCFSPDGSTVLSASESKTLKLWHVETGVCLQTLGGNTDGVTAYAFSHDGRLIASGSKDKTLRIWAKQ